MADPTPSNANIRTYAKDVAALQGKEPPATTAAAAKTPAASAPEAPVDAERQAVLDRLRDRATKDPVHQSEMLPKTLPTPVPKAEPVGSVEPPPVVQEPLSILPPPAPTPQPVVAPPPPPPPPVPVAPEASPLHTYTSDFSDHIDKKDASAFSVLAAQSDAGQLATPAPTSGKRSNGSGIVFAALGIVLILGAGVGAYAAYRYVQKNSVVLIGESVPSLVFADDRQALTGEGRQLLQAMADSAATPLPDGQVRVLYLTVASTTASGGTTMTPLTGGRLIGSLQLAAPEILLRNVAPESTVGIVHAGEETRAFFILRVLSYERTFAGMLQWEDTIQEALRVLYPEYPEPELPPAVGTSTPTAALSTAPPRFIDEVTSNHDVRALKDSQNNTILVYGYKDKETLIIARNEAAFAELLNRLSATKEQ